MQSSTETLVTGFRSLQSEHAVRLVLCHHAADLYPDDALHLAEYHDADRAELVFSFAGDSGGDWRDVWLIGGDDDQWRRYLELANEAASLIGNEAADCGVSAETMAIQRPSTHRAGNPAFDEWKHSGAAKWTFAVLDLAMAGMLPIDCQKYPVDPVARRADALRARAAMQPGSDDPEPEIQQAQRRGYLAELPDVVRASTYAIDRLAPPQDDDTKWSKADSPSEWAKVFGRSSRTFVRWIDEGKIRAKVLDSKNIMVDLRDMPTLKR